MSMVPEIDPWHVTDGVITIRPPRVGDTVRLLAGRDDEWARWLGPGADDPQPTACIALANEVIGWIDYANSKKLAPEEVNIGYNMFAVHRRQGYASRAMMLLLHRLAIEGKYRLASVKIDAGNVGSLRVAERAKFVCRPYDGKSIYLVRSIPPLSYSDGVVTIRRQDPSDIDEHLASIDQEQIRWMWQPGERQNWESMTTEQQRKHASQGLERNHDSFGKGPKWTFAVDTANDRYVAYVDCDLATPPAPVGGANIAYSCHPDHRGQGYVSRAVRLVMQFLAEHTIARHSQFVVDCENEASLRVARSIAAGRPPEPHVDEHGRAALRFVVDLGEEDNVLNGSV